MMLLRDVRQVQEVRERALALLDIAQGGCATQVALRTGRRAQTVMGWVHAYNERGPEALAFRRTGGRPPFVPGWRPTSARPCAQRCRECLR